MKKFQFFEPEATPDHIHIGLRTIKTVVAVFIAAMLCYLRDSWPALAMMAVVICMQASTEKTIIMSLNRTLATVIGGVFGMGTVFLADVTGLYHIVPLYYLAVSVVMILVILLTLYIKKPSITALSCVVLISVAISRGLDSPYIGAMNRVIDTLIGIGAALLVNITLPNRKAKAAANPEE